MRTFYISLAIFIALVAWLLHKPIPEPAQGARALTDSEVLYVEKTFNYAMDNLKQGEHMDWSVAGINGRISVGKLYQSKMKVECRNYVEIARSYVAQNTEAGIACRRQGNEGWCRLGPNVPQSCALEVMESSFSKSMRFAAMQGSHMIDSALGTNVNVGSDGLAPPTPTISGIGGGLPDVNMPDVGGDVHVPAPWEWDKKK